MRASAFLALVSCSFSTPSSWAIAENLPAPSFGDAEQLSDLIEASPEEIKFRFRTKFNRVHVPDQSTWVLVAKKLETPPLLDGIDDDECWKAEGDQSEWKHRTQSAWVQVLTTDVLPRQTVLYTCYDDKNLYLCYVAEEPEPKSVNFIEKRFPGRQHYFEAFQGDCGELFLETDGVGGDGHGWQFIFNIYPHMLYDGLNPWSAEGMEWDSGARSKGAMGPKRWIVELALPFGNFKWGNYAYQGPPKRGERWGIRIIRDGRMPPTGENRMESTWTFNPVKSWHNPWPTGVLIFEDPNLLRNGKFDEDLDNDGKLDFWVTKKSRDAVDASLAFDKEQGFGALHCKLTEPEDLFQVSQKIGVRPNKFYRLTGKLKISKGVGKVTVGLDRPARQAEVSPSGEWQDIKLEVFSSGAQQEMNVYLLAQGGVEEALLDDLTMVHDPFGIEEGMQCLTGNSFRQDLNVREAWNVQGRYTYREPGTAEFKPPYRKQWMPQVANGYDDEGTKSAAEGWIPFDKGSLTKGGHNLVQWPWVPGNPPLEPTYPLGHELIFDLGQDFFVTGIDSLFAMPIEQMLVYVKPEKTDDFVLIDKLNGPGVLDPPGAIFYYRARGLNSVARYVKCHWYEETNEGGAQFFCQIWGIQKGSHTDLEVTRFRWKKGMIVERPKVPSFYRIREPFIVPQPQEVEWTDKPFVITPATKVVCAEEGLIPGIGQDFSDDTFEVHGVRLPVVGLAQELTANPGLKDCVVIGDVPNSATIAELAEQAGLKVTASDPGSQGYVLLADSDRVLIIGSGEDQQGAFYGVTSLMQILHRDANSRLVIPGCRIRDWPKALLRDTMFFFQDPLRLADEYKKILSLYSLVRVNSTTHGAPFVDPYNPAQRKVHEDLRNYARRHFIVQGRLGSDSRGVGWPISTEMGDDEDEKFFLEELPSISRINQCPSSSHAFFEVRQTLERSLYDQPIDAERWFLNLDEMSHTTVGSRWNADRRCQRRGMDGGRLFYEFICRSYDMARRLGVKVETINTMLSKHAEGSMFHNMGAAYPFLPHDMVMYIYKGAMGDPESDPMYAVERFERIVSKRLYRDYGNAFDPRAWGARNHFWGYGSNEGMVIGQLAKEVGGQCLSGDVSMPVMAEYLWSPAKPMPNTFEFVNRLVNLTVRLNERYFGRPFPSWQEDRQPQWFVVDLRSIANWSHIDEVPADGKGWLDWGSNFDLRLLHKGDVKLEEVPFHILDPHRSCPPASGQSPDPHRSGSLQTPDPPDSGESGYEKNPNSNHGRSIIFLANYPPDSTLAPTLPSRSPDIPINRKVASLCFLKMRVGAGIPPSYVATYEDGRQLTFNLDVRDTEVARTYAWDYAHDYEKMPLYGKNMGNPNPLALHIDFLSRPGWLGYTASGDECSARIHEWVNPYPELAVRSISVFYPACQQSEERTAILAISGIEAEQQDFDRWAKKERPPLRLAKVPAAIEGLKTVVAGGKPEVEELKGARRLGYRTTNRYVDSAGNVLFSVEGADEGARIFNDDNKSCFLRGVSEGRTKWSVTVTFARPATVEVIALRGRFMTWKEFAGSIAAGTFKLAQADYRVHARLADGSWRQVGECLSACGEDDTYFLPVPSLTINQIRVEVDTAAFCKAYYGHDNCPGFSYLQAYSR